MSEKTQICDKIGMRFSQQTLDVHYYQQRFEIDLCVSLTPAIEHSTVTGFQGGSSAHFAFFLVLRSLRAARTTTRYTAVTLCVPVHSSRSWSVRILRHLDLDVLQRGEARGGFDCASYGARCQCIEHVNLTPPVLQVAGYSFKRCKAYGGPSGRTQASQEGKAGEQKRDRTFENRLHTGWYYDKCRAIYNDVFVPHGRPPTGGRTTGG